MKVKIYTVIMFALALSACSNSGHYNSMQRDNQRECEKLPEGAYKACIEQQQMSFNEYKHQRKQLLDNNQTKISKQDTKALKQAIEKERDEYIDDE